ncbi:hypothetical protein ACLMAJ_34155 [Nocardia sp. KC 131]|uniref:hypothetical protein n=1 Tax=Nocardia arseniciresistens TaxID=3392119 RepID=UPI00398F61E7
MLHRWTHAESEWTNKNTETITDTVREARVEDGHGAREVSGTMDGDGLTDAARPRTPTTDLSHMPPLGELVDGGLRGDLDDYDLTVAFRGLEHQYGPYHLEDVAAWHEESWIYDDGRIKPAEVSFTGQLRDADGADAGSVLYSFYRDDRGRLVVKNNLTELNDGFRGKGFSTAFSGSTEEYFRRSGADRILVTAALADGGAAWAKAGYDWDDDPHNLATSIGNMKARIGEFLDELDAPISDRDAALLRDMRTRFDGPSTGFPSPQELVMLAGDNPKLGDDLMRGSTWHGMKTL